MQNPSASHSPTSRGAYAALALLFAINLFNYIDRYILASVEPLIREDFKLTEAQTGMLVPAFLISYMIGVSVLGSLGDKISRWLLIGVSVAAWSLASGWSGLAGSFAVLLVTRLFVGIGEAGYGPAAPALIADLFSMKRRGTMLSLFYIAIPVGSALGYVLGGFVGANFGWRWAFYCVVPPGLVLAGLCCFMREPRTERPATEAKPKLRLADYLALIRIRSFAYNTAAMAMMTFAIGGIAFWIPSYILGYRALEIDPNAVVLGKQLLGPINTIFGAIVVLGGLFSTILGGWLGEKLRPRFGGAYFLVSGGGMFLAFPATLAMLWIPFPYAWGAIFIAVFFLFFNTGPSNTAIANVTSPAIRSTAFAVNIFIIHALGDAISPPLLGWIAGWSSMKTAFTVVAGVMVISGMLWMLGARHLAADTAAAAGGETGE